MLPDYNELQRIDEEIAKLLERKKRVLRQIENASSIVVLLFVLIGFYVMIIDEEERLRYKRKNIIYKIRDTIAGEALSILTGDKSEDVEKNS